MVLAIDYMQRTGTTDAALKARATKYLDQGFKRLLTFESKQHPGGFSLWQNGQPSVFLTAFGLMQFTDMQSVYDVPQDLLPRITKFLRSQQADDGSYGGGNLAHAWGSWKSTPVYMTAYVAWAMARAGADTSKALAWLDPRAEDMEDPYGLSLAALAFLAADPKSKTGHALVDRVAALKNADSAKGTFWAPTGETFVGARGHGAQIETTAIAILLLQQAKQHDTLAWDALDTLVSWRDKSGRFGSTHSTALALRALIGAQSGSGTLPTTNVSVLRKGRVVKQIVVPSGSTEPIRVAIGQLDPSELKLRLDGEGRMRATVSRTTYEPWDTTKAPTGTLALEIEWPQGPMGVDKPYEAKVTIRNGSKSPAKVVTAEIGLPPGITVKPEDVSGKGLAEAERARRSMTLYLDTMQPGEVRTYVLPFRTRYPFTARTAPSRVYEYYVEAEQTVVPPVRLQVK